MIVVIGKRVYETKASNKSKPHFQIMYIIMAKCLRRPPAAQPEQTDRVRINSTILMPPYGNLVGEVAFSFCFPILGLSGAAGRSPPNEYPRTPPPRQLAVPRLPQGRGFPLADCPREPAPIRARSAVDPVASSGAIAAITSRPSLSLPKSYPYLIHFHRNRQLIIFIKFS